ncbi:unnamed protein product [Sphagnum troendelagicum]|uniref:Protein kinase domain-containing protein n=1 Tax=Sphagnum troendelagicum TaxID=128251 RepID=A0ABP0UJZ2_9BRYO
MDFDHSPLHNQLCNYLRLKLYKTKIVLEYHKTASIQRAANSQEGAFRELELVVRRADDLLLKCMCKQSSWLDAAVTLPNIKEEVLDIVLDLSFWKRMLATAHSDKGGLARLQYTAKALEKDEDLREKLLKADSPLQKAADDDMNHLLKKLLKVKGKHASGREGSTASIHEREYILSIYLLSRIKDDDRIATEVESQLKDIKWGKPLGSGAYGQVSQVEWLQRPCAVKRIQQTDPKEATMARGCNHPNIVQFFWVFQDERSTYIIMERMHEDLSEHINRRLVESNDGRPFQLHVAIDIMLQIAKAMRYLHNKKPDKIVHRDLKTSNILVRPLTDRSQGYVHVKLADFGISKIYNMSVTSSPMTLKKGTTVYSAPEIFNYQSKYGSDSSNLPPKIDVWSFSMVCSEILTGIAPYHGHQKMNLHAKIEEVDDFRPPLPSDIPEDLRYCITRCWECDPRKRPTFTEICKMLKTAKAQSLGIIHFTSSKRLASINQTTVNNPTSSEPQAASSGGDSKVEMTGGPKENRAIDQITSLLERWSLKLSGPLSDTEMVDAVEAPNSSPTSEPQAKGVDLSKAGLTVAASATIPRLLPQHYHLSREEGHHFREPHYIPSLMDDDRMHDHFPESPIPPTPALPPHSDTQHSTGTRLRQQMTWLPSGGLATSGRTNLSSEMYLQGTGVSNVEKKAGLENGPKEGHQLRELHYLRSLTDEWMSGQFPQSSATPTAEPTPAVSSQYEAKATSNQLIDFDFLTEMGVGLPQSRMAATVAFQPTSLMKGTTGVNQEGIWYPAAGSVALPTHSGTQHSTGTDTWAMTWPVSEGLGTSGRTKLSSEVQPQGSGSAHASNVEKKGGQENWLFDFTQHTHMGQMTRSPSGGLPTSGRTNLSSDVQPSRANSAGASDVEKKGGLEMVTTETVQLTIPPKGTTGVTQEGVWYPATVLAALPPHSGMQHSSEIDPWQMTWPPYGGLPTFGTTNLSLEVQPSRASSPGASDVEKKEGLDNEPQRGRVCGEEGHHFREPHNIPSLMDDDRMRDHFPESPIPPTLALPPHSGTQHSTGTGLRRQMTWPPSGGLATSGRTNLSSEMQLQRAGSAGDFTQHTHMGQMTRSPYGGLSTSGRTNLLSEVQPQPPRADFASGSNVEKKGGLVDDGQRQLQNPSRYNPPLHSGLSGADSNLVDAMGQNTTPNPTFKPPQAQIALRQDKPMPQYAELMAKEEERKKSTVFEKELNQLQHDSKESEKWNKRKKADSPP